MMNVHPWNQDSIPIPDVDPPGPDDALKAGDMLANLILAVPGLIAAIIVGYLVYRVWKNRTLRTGLLVIGACFLFWAWLRATGRTA